MAAPVVVVLDRSPSPPLDLTPLVAPGSLNWSSGIPGGFASAAFMLLGDPRKLTNQVPYLSILRVVGDSGRVLFEGQVEDKDLAVSSGELGLAVTCFGLQNALKETGVRRIWSKRDMAWVAATILAGMNTNAGTAVALKTNGWQVNSGQFDPTNPTRTGVQVVGVSGATLATADGGAAEFDLPIGLTAQKLLGTCLLPTTNGYVGAVWASAAGAAFGNALATFAGSTTTDFSQGIAGAAQVRVGAYISSGAGATLTSADGPQFYNLRVLGTTVTEDVAAVAHAGGGFYGGTLIRDLLTQVPALTAGVIEAGSDFAVDHLDAGVRRAAGSILAEVASYYSREWAVWENAALNWTTPNLQQNQWVIPLAQLASLNLDATVNNSQKQAVVLYTDAASGLTGEQAAASVDRRNPYVLQGRAKDNLVTAGTMTSNTAAQLAAAVLNDLGYGPVPAAGTVSLLGETLVQHAQGKTLKAWEIRAGDNVTLPELPMVDVFTQDGRGEVLFHIVSAEADADTGLVTLTLDSYGSKRSDVLLARLAAVTSLLGG